ncbi:MAG: ankyrin repeat domain-containing protein, partial [Parachlamydiaceae bacterium]
MNSWSPQCTHSQKEYRQLYDLVEQSGPATINASNSHVESHGVQTITLTHIHMSPTLSLSQRIALLERIIRSGCSKCALDLTQKAVCWLNNPESGLTNRAILYLVTAYKIEKKCKGDTTEIETKIWEVVSCYPCQRENNLLHHFIESEAFPIIRYLLKCQFQGEVKSWLEQKNEKGRLPIHTAIMQGNIETVRLLLRFCPSQLLNTQDKDGNTLLHLAVQQAIESKEDRKKFEPVIKDLLKRNANPEIENSKREKPFDLACDSEEVKAIFFTSHSFCLGHVKNKMTDFYQSNGGEIERSLLVNAPPLKIEQCFINLSIVKEKVQKNTETEALGKREKREQIFGGYEDVFKTVNKEPIFPKDLFEPREGKTPKRLLILGRAGIGKSTLCKYLTHQCWSADGVWKNRFALVVKINLRNLTKERYPNKNVSLAEIIVRECFKPTDEEKKEIKYINKVLASISAEQKLFLLDGYDEFPADSPCKATINTLLNPQNDSYLIVTSRPYAKVNSENFDFSLECIGFTSEDIPKYLNLPGVCKDADTAKKILAFLKQNPAIHNLAHIPILLDLLTLSNEVILASESVTITKLYEHIVTKIWEKYDSKQLELNFDQKGVEATQEQAEQFLKALAFHSFLEHGIVFNYKSVEEVAIEACGWKKLQIASRVESLMTPGFLNCYRDKILTENQYSFPHLTIQEYQAALFITDWLSTDREIQVYKENTRKREKTTAQQFILKNRYNPRFQIIWHFMSGILADSKQEHLQDFFSCLLQEPKDIIGSYHTCLLIRCLEEAEIPDLENANLLTQLKNNCEILIRKKSMPLLDALNLSRKMVSKLEVMKLIVSLLKNHPSVDSYETPNVFLFFKELVKLRHSFPEESISILMKCLSIDRELISSSAGEVLGAIVQVEPDRSNQILTDLLKLSQGENDKAAFAAIYAIGE